MRPSGTSLAGGSRTFFFFFFFLVKWNTSDDQLLWFVKKNQTSTLMKLTDSSSVFTGWWRRRRTRTRDVLRLLPYVTQKGVANPLSQSEWGCFLVRLRLLTRTWSFSESLISPFIRSILQTRYYFTTSIPCFVKLNIAIFRCIDIYF